MRYDPTTEDARRRSPVPATSRRRGRRTAGTSPRPGRAASAPTWPSSTPGPAPSCCGSRRRRSRGRHRGRPPATRIAFLHIAGPDRRPRLAKLDRHRRRSWTVGPGPADRVSRPRRRLAPRLVHPGRPAPAAVRRAAPRSSVRRARAPRHAVPPTYLIPRSAGAAPPRSDASSASASIPIRRALPDGLLGRTSPASRRSRRLAARGGRAVRGRGQAEPGVLRGVRVGRPGRARAASGAAIPADVPVVADAKRGDIGITAARQAVALFDGLGADAVTVNPYLGDRGDRAAPRAGRPVRLRPVPDLEPGRRRAPGPDVGRCGERGARPSRCWARVARRAAGWGPGARSGSSSAPPRRRSSPRSGPSRRVWRSSCRASAPRAAGRAGPRATGRRPRHRPAAARRRPPRQRLAGHRGGRDERAGAPPRAGPGATPASASPRPPPTGRPTPCAIVGRPDMPIRRHGIGLHTRSWHPMPFGIRPFELIIILVIALLVLGPGKLPDVGSALGKSIREFRKASSDVQDAVKAHVDDAPSRDAARGSCAQRAGRDPRETASPTQAATTASAAPGASSEPTPGPNEAARASREMADADALREAGVPGLPVTPGPDPAPPTASPVARRRCRSSTTSASCGAGSSASSSRSSPGRSSGSTS